MGTKSEFHSEVRALQSSVLMATKQIARTFAKETKLKLPFEHPIKDDVKELLKKKLRIAYVSPYFYDHPTAHLVTVEVICL